MQVHALHVGHELGVRHGAAAEGAVGAACHVRLQRVSPHALVRQTLRPAQLARVGKRTARHPDIQ